MGFSAPKPDPALVAQQKAQAALARVDRISLIQQQLDNEDQLRTRLYGTRGTSLFAAPTSALTSLPGMRNLFSASGPGLGAYGNLSLGGSIGGM